MSEFNQKAITDKGLVLSTNALNGDVLTFTRIALGSGVYVGDFGTIEGLVNQEVSLDLKGISINGNEVVLSTVLLPNSLTSSFAWSELGVFAKGADDVEVLYFYANATNTSYIDKDSLDEKIINVALIVENTSNITALIDSGLVYATQADIESHNTSTNAHQDIRNMIQNIDLTSVTDVVSNEHNITRTLVKNSHDATKSHITNENTQLYNKMANVVTDIKQHVTTQNTNSNTHTTTEINKSITAINTALNSLLSRIQKAETNLLSGANRGDYSGKHLKFETVKVTGVPSDTYGVLKEYTNSKGGVLKWLKILSNGVEAQKVRITVDGEVIIRDVSPSKFVTNASEGNDYTWKELDIPFEKSVKIEITSFNSVQTFTADFLYYINP